MTMKLGGFLEFQKWYKTKKKQNSFNKSICNHSKFIVILVKGYLGERLRNTGAYTESISRTGEITCHESVSVHILLQCTVVEKRYSVDKRPHHIYRFLMVSCLRSLKDVLNWDGINSVDIVCLRPHSIKTALRIRLMGLWRFLCVNCGAPRLGNYIPYCWW